MKQARPRPAQRGSILLLVVMLMLGVAMLSLALVSMTNAFHGEQQSSREELSAQLVCEAGLGEAYLQLQTTGDGNLGSEAEPIAYGDGSFWVVATDLGDERTALLATGVDDRARTSIEMIVAEEPGAFFQWGAFADDRLRMDSNASVDSYDSSDGSYASQESGSGSSAHANENGDIGSNGPITMDSNTIVWGDATPGPSSSVAQNGNSDVTGATTPLVTPVVFPPIAVPAGGPGASATINGVAVRPPGTYFFSNLTLNSNSVLTVTGPAVLVVRNLTVDSNSQLLVDALGGGVTIYVARNFVLNSNAQVRSLTSTPSDVAINLSSVPANTVFFDSNVQLHGTVYAPAADIRIDSNAQLFGAIMAWRLELNSNSRIHYDEALARQGGAEAGFRLLCWRMVEQ
jgi:hypothetical protein